MLERQSPAFSGILREKNKCRRDSQIYANLLHIIVFVNAIMIKYVVALKKMQDADFSVGREWIIFQQIHQSFGIAGYVFPQQLAINR